MTRITMDDDIVKTDLLIVGAGPAGAALACFLASHGRCLPQCAWQGQVRGLMMLTATLQDGQES